MSLSDCEKCWSTPCECGYYFRNYAPTSFMKYIKNISLSYFRYRYKRVVSEDEEIRNNEEEVFIDELINYIKSKNENKN